MTSATSVHSENPGEKRIRSGLPVIRLLTGYMPLGLMRGLNKLSLGAARLAEGVTVESLTVAGQPAEWFRAAGGASGPVLLYLHGGGFILPVSILHRTYVSHLARALSGAVLMIEYRLAPEHPFPAGLDDSLNAWRWLLSQGYAPEQMAVAGDSAGGNFALALLQAIKQSGDPMPAAVIAHSPVTDMVYDRENDPAVATEEMLHPRAMRKYHADYVQDLDAHDPRISPALGDLSGLPPTLIFAGERELLCRDSVAYAEAAQAAGSPVTLHIEPRMWHAWPLNAPDVPQAVDALAQTAAFVRTHVASRAAVAD
jgi:acetyl esterase/lipase